jgi:hypothetical protein
MNKFVFKLQSKVKAVEEQYGPSSEEPNEASDSDNEPLFSSMQRWHENSHMQDDDWISCFDQIKGKLKIEASRLKDAPSDIVEMLNMKFDETSLQNKFCVSDIFSDKFLSCVKTFFEVKIAERDAGMDEFDEENIFEGWKSEDAILYTRTFLPFAVFYTYKEKHQDNEDKGCFDDCFTIGSGSRRGDLFPEVNAYCKTCCIDYNLKFEFKNQKIFKMQMENKFNLLVNIEDSDSESDGKGDSDILIKNIVDDKNTLFNPFLSDSDEISSKDNYEDEKAEETITPKVNVFNPFLGESDELSSKDSTEYDKIQEVEESNSHLQTNQKVKPFKCFVCPKCFSRENFLRMHTKIFHGKNKKVVAKFITEPVDLITSFCTEDSSNEKPSIVATTKPRARKTKCSDSNSDKIKIRKSLRFDK